VALTTPKHRGVLWAAANIALDALVPAAVLYFGRELNAGAYPVDADSIGIPIKGIAMWVLILLVPLNLALWLLLRGYAGKTALTASTQGLPFGSRLIAASCLTLGVLFVAVAVLSFGERAPEFTAVFLLWCYVALALRAAVVGAARASGAPDSRGSKPDLL
jgi:hypothetical protein